MRSVRLTACAPRPAVRQMWIDDTVLVRCAEDLTVSVWVPDHVLVVCGAANDPDREVVLSACAANNVPVVKRYGGGGTVVLSPDCVVVSVGTWVRDPFQNHRYFTLLNQALIDALAAAWPIFADLTQAGVSDVVHGERKVVGTSLFRSRNYILYQASLIVTPAFELLARYLKHPSREPEYRRGRAHRDFVTGLAAIAEAATAAEVAEKLQLHLPTKLTDRLRSERVAPQAEQQENLLARARAGRATGDK